MFERFRNSWAISDISFDVLTRHLKLLVFPILTITATFVIVLFFLGTFLFQPTGYDYSDKSHWKAVASSVFTQESLDKISAKHAPGERQQLELNRTGIVISAGLYFFFMFLATFFNVAFYHEILEALHDRPVSVGQGISFAVSKIKVILLWSLLAGIVGYVIKQFERRFGFFGRLVVNLIGLAWSVAAIFAIPVIVSEEEITNPITVLQTSAGMLKRAWGETLIGFAGMQLGLMFGILLSVIPFGGLILIGVTLETTMLVAVGWIAWVLFLMGFIYFAGVASNIYHCALYVFARTGTLPTGFSREMMNLAWKHKPS